MFYIAVNYLDVLSLARVTCTVVDCVRLKGHSLSGVLLYNVTTSPLTFSLDHRLLKTARLYTVSYDVI